MIEYITSGGARVNYYRLPGYVTLVEIARHPRPSDPSDQMTTNGFFFSRKSWDELTAVLFPPCLNYAIDPDVYLP